MSYPIEVRISLCDPLNTGFGYQVKITRREERLFFGTLAPDTGEDLQSIADCLRVVAMYVSQDDLAQIVTESVVLLANTVTNSKE